MRLVRLLSLPYFARHRLRSLLTLAGIALGVAVLVAMYEANESVLAGLRQTITHIAGAADLQVSAGDTGIPEDLLDRVRAVREVGSASPVVEAVVGTGRSGQGNLLVLGVDMTSDQGIRDYDLGGSELDDPLVFLAQPDSIMIGADFASRNGLALGSRLVLETVEGARRFTVRGLLRPAGLAQAFGGSLAVMDIYAAQRVFGKESKFDRIDITARRGVTVEDCRRALAAALGPGFHVDAPSERRRYFEQVLADYRRSSGFASIFALIVGLFLIQNTLVVAVAQRRGEIGILRALGATRRQIRALFLIESGCIGLAGSLVGALLGAGLSRLAARYVAETLEGVYGVIGQPARGGVGPLLIAGAIAAGVAWSVLAAVFPASAAARVDPVRALQKGRYEIVQLEERRTRGWLACTAVSMAVLLLAGRFESWFVVSYVLAALALILLTPELSSAVVRLLRPLLERMRPMEGALAADSLLQAPRRTASVAAALMLSVAMVIGLGGIAEASYRSILDWVTGTLDADFLVAPSENLKDLTLRFPSAMERDLGAIEGLTVVQPVRAARVSVRNSQPILFAVDIVRLSPQARRRAIPVNTERVHQLAAQGRGVIVSDSFAARERVRVGDVLDLPAPDGPLRLPVLGIYKDFTDPQGAIVMDRSLYRSRWHDDTVNLFRLYLAPGASAETVRQQVLARVGANRRLFVFSSADLRRHVMGLAGRWFEITYAQLAIALLVAVLGIANALTVSITDRRRELGILRAVGGLRRQVRVAVWMEAAAVAVVGFVLGLAFSMVNIFYALSIFSDHALEFRFPGLLAAELLPMLVAAALVAAIMPAEAAVRAPLVSALEYE
jgi:putative ABC transport system permease protein